LLEISDYATVAQLAAMTITVLTWNPARKLNRHMSDFANYNTGATPATKKSPKLYRIEQHESLTVSNILALHRRAGWVDGTYYLAVSLMMV
jgi:hypothetical protein